MVREKGFVYIMEVVMISIILIVSLVMMVRPLTVDEDWDMVELRRLGESALGAVEQSEGIGELVFNESSPLHLKLDNLLYRTGEPEAVSYRLEMSESYRDEIKIGFSCEQYGCDGEEEIWQELLGKVWMNNRFFRLSENLEEVDWAEFEDESYRQDFDVIVLRGQETVSGRENVENFLEEGGGIVKFSEASEAEGEMVEGKEVFGVTKENGEEDVYSFKNRKEPEKENYEPSKLFYGMGTTAYQDRDWKIQDEEYSIDIDDEGETVNITDGQYEYCINCKEGDIFVLDNVDYELLPVDEHDFRIRKISSDGDMVWIDYLEDSKLEGHEFSSESFNSSATSEEEEFEVLGADGAHSMVVNKPYRGRSAWISYGQNNPGEETMDDIKSLVRAGVVWTAPRGEVIKENEIPPTRKTSEITRFGFVNDDIYEPYVLTMELWYSY